VVLDVWASDGQDSFDYRRCIGRMVRFQMEGVDQAAMRYDSACLSFGNPCIERPLYLAKASQFGGAPRAEKKVKLNQAVLRKGATLDII